MNKQTPWIANVPRVAIETGEFVSKIPSFNPAETVLIRILDIGFEFSAPAHEYYDVHKFKFMDTNKETDPDCINEADAEQLAEILSKALEENRNVIVHCTAGRCRSGAIVEVGTIMGFKDLGLERQPNIVVKSMLLRTLGLSY